MTLSNIAPASKRSQPATTRVVILSMIDDMDALKDIDPEKEKEFLRLVLDKKDPVRTALETVGLDPTSLEGQRFYFKVRRHFLNRLDSRIQELKYYRARL